MANVYATKTGNWSDATVWNTAALPTSSDDVYSNNFTVTIDQNVTVKSLRNTSASGITAGGGFVCSTTRTIDCSGGSGFIGGTQQLTVSPTAGQTVTTLGSVTSTSGLASGGIFYTGAGDWSHTGAITTGTNNTGVNVGGTGTFTYSGTITLGSSAGASTGIFVNAVCTCNITATLSGTDFNIAGNTNYGGHISVLSNAAVNITAAVSGATTAGATGSGIVVSATGATVTITGSLTGGNRPAVYSKDQSTIVVTGPFYSSTLGVAPFYVYGPMKLAAITSNEYRFLSSVSGTSSLWSSDVNTGAPTAANVRYGTRYGAASEFTGTCQVPAAASVLYGVPVDNTTGTASLTSDPQLTPL